MKEFLKNNIEIIAVILTFGVIVAISILIN